MSESHPMFGKSSGDTLDFFIVSFERNNKQKRLEVKRINFVLTMHFYEIEYEIL